MVTFRPDTSFPYLALARRAGTDYADLLRTADRLKYCQMSELQWLIDTSPLIAAIVGVEMKERQRRAKIAHDALHNGEAP